MLGSVRLEVLAIERNDNVMIMSTIRSFLDAALSALIIIFASPVLLLSSIRTASVFPKGFANVFTSATNTLLLVFGAFAFSLFMLLRHMGPN